MHIPARPPSNSCPARAWRVLPTTERKLPIPLAVSLSFAAGLRPTMRREKVPRAPPLAQAGAAIRSMRRLLPGCGQYDNRGGGRMQHWPLQFAIWASFRQLKPIWDARHPQWPAPLAVIPSLRYLPSRGLTGRRRSKRHEGLCNLQLQGGALATTPRENWAKACAPAFFATDL